MTYTGNTLIQAGLTQMGYAPGAPDGLFGPKTHAAAVAWLTARGAPAPHALPVTDLPWMAQAKRVLGRHETRDNGWLRKWLRSDGRTLGDPAQLPWCGDFVETCIRLALPKEPFPGALGENPYWARNWLRLGFATALTYGAIVVFSRGTGGHVGFAVGQNEGAIHVLGGNQSNAVTIARIDRARLLGARWPATFPTSPISLLRVARDGKLSTNEA